MKFTLDNFKKSNDFLNFILNSIDSAIFIVSKDFEIKDINESFGKLFSKPSDEIIGKLFGDAVSCIYSFNGEDCNKNPECSECVLRNAINSSFNKKTIKTKFNLDFMVNDQKLSKIFKLSTKYFNFHENEMVLVIITDMTESEIQKIKLKELNEEKNNFLGFAAHDLRNPIGLIQVYAEFLLNQLSANLQEEQVKIINKINDTCYSMLDLLNDLIDITKIETGHVKITKDLLNYADFVKYVIEIKNMIADKKKIKIIQNFDSDDIKIKFDKIKIEQVLNNLLSNAIKFSEFETAIQVNVKKAGDKILTEVIDQGQGIPDEEINKIFNPFHKTSIKPTNGESSTGLGLAIVKKIIEAHDGEVFVESKTGVGSNFYFYLPIE